MSQPLTGAPAPVSDEVLYRPARPGDWDAIAALLAASELPLAGAREHLDAFLLAERGGRIIGCAALEQYATSGLLRSVAVDQAERGRGTGAALVERVLAKARAAGLSELVLLTTTAEHFFPRFGFEVVARDAVPAGVQASAEFRGACPASATVMRLVLTSGLG